MATQSLADTLLKSFSMPSFSYGSSSWWQQVRATGCPIFETYEVQTSPLEFKKKCLVAFFWQDPEGNELTSNTEKVLLDVNSLTDHHSWDPQSLSRIENTDVWFSVMEIDYKWRGSYSFIPLKKFQLPCVAKERSDQSRDAQRKWWMSIADQQEFDPLNPSPGIVSGWGMASPLHGPLAPTETGWQDWDNGVLKAVSAEEIKVLNWQSALLDNCQRSCLLFSTTNENAPLVILLDGQKWASDSGTLSVLKHLTKQNKIAPAHYLLIPSIKGEYRWKELSCSEIFWQQLVSELLPQTEEILRETKSSFSFSMVAGQSLGGLSALYASLIFPDIFPKAISISGSYWWPDISLMKDSDRKEQSLVLPEGSLAQQILNKNFKVEHLEIFLSSGTGEGDLSIYNQQTREAIEQCGGQVYYESFHGGHDWLAWRSSLIRGLITLLPTN